MLLIQGEKIHVMTRRRMEGEARRHFVGEVKGVSEGAARAEKRLVLTDGGSYCLDINEFGPSR